MDEIEQRSAKVLGWEAVVNILGNAGHTASAIVEWNQS